MRRRWAVLLIQPFDSLAVLTVVIAIGALLLAVGALVDSRSAATRWPGRAATVLWLVVAIAVATSGATTAVLALLVGIALIVSGVLDVVAGLRGSTDERLASIIGGAASIVFGGLAVVWPSVTALVIAVVFGFKLMLFGLRLAWTSVRFRGAVGWAVGRSGWAGVRVEVFAALLSGPGPDEAVAGDRRQLVHVQREHQHTPDHVRHGQLRAVRAERHRAEAKDAVVDDALDLSTVDRVPQPDGPIAAARRDTLVVG